MKKVFDLIVDLLRRVDLQAQRLFAVESGIAYFV